MKICLSPTPKISKRFAVFKCSLHDDPKFFLRITTSYAIAHIFLRTISPNTAVFCSIYNYPGKADLRKGRWDPKRNLGLTKHSSERINQHYLQKALKLLCMAFFDKLKLYYLWKMRCCPQWYFWISKARLAKNRAKISLN